MPASAQKTQAARQRLLRAAEKVFRERGLGEATLREIAAGAGMTTGAVYSHFGSKNELLLAVIEAHIDRRLDDVYRQVRDAEQREVGTVAGTEFGRFLEDERAWVVLVIEFWAQAVRDPALRKQFAARRRKLVAAISELVEARARSAGVELALPPDQLSLVLIALSNGMAIERIADPRRVSADLVRDALRLLLAGVAATARPLAAGGTGPGG